MPESRLAANLLLEAPSVIGSVEWSARDTVLYNLGIGFGATAVADERLLPFVLQERARAFPTMVCVLESRITSLFDPRFGIDFAGIVHGEEAIELHRPLPASGELRTERRVEGLWDKGEGRGAVLRVLRTLSDPSSGAIVATIRSTLMLRRNGGFGGSNEGAPRPLASPEREADGLVTVATLPEQALLYRLSGDTNPLHVDPEVARAAGFPKPILMGLCSFALAGRALVATLAGGAAERLTALSMRFSGVVFPGDTLCIEHWRLDDGDLAFRGTVPARGATVLDGGRARIT
jgi:acyl dehydratase